MCGPSLSFTPVREIPDGKCFAFGGSVYQKRTVRHDLIATRVADIIGQALRGTKVVAELEWVDNPVEEVFNADADVHEWA